uniref:Proline rich 3 n=1 Tax=Molossus molossus TaxID=27622 RepID=A0A7J8GTD4_MOLMO|nr:proline rich 3 [Molossus molossus]
MGGLSLPGHRPPEAETESSVPLPHCPPNPAAAIAATTMPKRKKQNQQQPPPPPQSPVPTREETGDGDDGSPLGPPSLLGPPPMANGKPGDPMSAPNWNPPTCPPSVEWINKLLCVHAMGHYTAMKTNELLLQATWMNLTNMMLSERSQTQKNADSLHRGPPGSRGLMIPPLLSLPPPPRGRGPVWGGLGPRQI